MPVDPFPRVKEAREALKAKAIELLARYEKIIDLAMEKGDLETAAAHTQWLIEHLPNEAGTTMIDQSAAKPKVSDKPVGPSIQIGFALGGVNTEAKQLQPVIIEVPKD